MMKHRTEIVMFSVMLAIQIVIACNVKSNRHQEDTPEADSLIIIRNREAREDSLEMVRALSRQAEITTVLFADLETEPVGSPEDADAADDPAIWYNEADPSASLILGTDKKAGLYVYDLNGKILQYREVGMINNVDLRDGFSYQGKEVVLVAGSNRSNNCITLMLIDKQTGWLSDSLKNIPSGVDEVYGISCFHDPQKDSYHLFVNGKGGLLEQWELIGNGTLEANLLRSIQLSSQPEGMVCNDQKALLYVGIEQEGVFYMDARPQGDNRLQLLPGSDDSNPDIAYDIEGLALFSYEGSDYLIASSQGSFSYALFSLEGKGSYLKSFILSDNYIDGVEETDGIDVVTYHLNNRFPQGLLVAQDGFNTDGWKARSQNFKYVSFQKVLELL
jgi:3-phytase